MRNRVRIADGREGQIVGSISTSRGQFEIIRLDDGKNWNHPLGEPLERILDPRWLARFDQMPKAAQMDLIEHLYETMRGTKIILADARIRELRKLSGEASA